MYWHIKMRGRFLLPVGTQPAGDGVESRLHHLGGGGQGRGAQDRAAPAGGPQARPHTRAQEVGGAQGTLARKLRLQ